MRFAGGTNSSIHSGTDTGTARVMKRVSHNNLYATTRNVAVPGGLLGLRPS